MRCSITQNRRLWNELMNRKWCQPASKVNTAKEASKLLLLFFFPLFQPPRKDAAGKWRDSAFAPITFIVCVCSKSWSRISPSLVWMWPLLALECTIDTPPLYIWSLIKVCSLPSTYRDTYLPTTLWTRISGRRGLDVLLKLIFL